MFGQNCGEKCGECVNDEQCHHINGTCLNGCDRGFQGHECNEGEVFSFMARCPYSLYEQFSLKQISGYFLYDIEYSKQRYVMWTCVVLTTIKYEFYAVRINKIISIKFRIHFFLSFSANSTYCGLLGKTTLLFHDQEMASFLFIYCYFCYRF